MSNKKYQIDDENSIDSFDIIKAVVANIVIREKEVSQGCQSCSLQQSKMFW